MTYAGNSFDLRHRSGWDGARVTFVSDLHLMTRRSDITRRRSAIDAAIDDCEVVILGGDLFDFRWSTFDEAASLRWAEDWLFRLMDRHPAKRWIYLIGNHDCLPQWQTLLRVGPLSRRWSVPPCDGVLMGRTLALHGDVIEFGGDDRGFSRYRRRWAGKPPAAVWKQPLYDAAVGGRLHRVAAAASHGRRSVCRRLGHWIDARFETPVQQVVFGHTHRRIDGRKVDGRTYWNPGAAVRHARFSPVRVVV